LSSIDVVLLTKNSEKVLAKCLTSVYKNVPVGRLIAVDGYSTDKTLEILDQFNKQYRNVKVVHDRGTRATARQKGIESVRSDWFLFVDSDVVLCKDWYRKAIRFVGEDVGAIWGIEVWSTIKNRVTLKIFLWLTRKIFDLRGGTHDMLVRSSLMSDIKIPGKLHVFEDAYIKDWIIRKGFKAVACYDPFCIHYRTEGVWTMRGSLNIAADAIRLGSFQLLGKLILAYGFYTAYSVYQLVENYVDRRS
jgi:glycosyltransferase involved in cell wall biosynthesis